MKFLKYLFLLILVILVAGAVYFGAQDGTFDVTATKDLKVPQSLAFKTAYNYQSWSQWGPWMQTDPNVQITYSDTLQGVGAGYSWVSDHPEVGQGNMKTVAITENEAIEQKITFNTPLGDSSSDVYWSFEPGPDNTTRVSWGMKGELSLLEKVFMSFQSGSFEEATKEMYEKGLENMENHILEQMAKFSVSFDGIVEYGGGYYMYVTESATTAGRAAKMGPMLGEVMTYMQSNNIQQSGAPFTIFHQMDEAAGTVIFSAAIPVKERINTAPDSNVLCGYIEPLTAIKTTLKGNYDQLDEAYKAAHTYIEEKALMLDPEKAQFEVYASDPGLEPNPANWLTEVYVPIIAPTETIN
ncbi:SRPBCC family protein [Gilvibacter sp.]|uniref:SRPBCC family protein n=1 Tax=Gilvibacter sp. TaxID=2729997 RepID=UPI0025C5FE3E|nr:SRPBCC family protein [Gilvibacter sp.]NQX77030.1 SRPBCC family protein [Gilvibacter sp.]